ELHAGAAVPRAAQPGDGRRLVRRRRARVARGPGHARVAPVLRKGCAQVLDIEFLSADEAAELDRRYGGKLHAVDAIDVRLERLAVQRVDDGRVPAALALAMALDGVTLVVGQRTRLPDAWIGRLRTAVHAHAALSGPLR